uniref:ZP domain-containing protein n=1 Tax=Caenorhabditis tropicalis TaxID=1561998 RepID=A0A1I7UDF0_9PELO
MHTILSAALLFLLPVLSSASAASVSVSGTLKCHGQPFKHEDVSLYEKNFIGADTKMTEVKTDESGSFLMKASISEWPMFTPNPYIYIPNYCTTPIKLGTFHCANTIKIYVPSEFVSQGHFPKSEFNVGEINLENAETDKQGLEIFVHAIFHHKECRTVKE